MPDRAAILARDGTPIAEGEARLTELGAGRRRDRRARRPAPPEQRDELATRGVPADTPVGLTGSSASSRARWRARPAATLRAGARVLARREPERGEAVRDVDRPRRPGAAVDGARRPLRRHRRARARATARCSRSPASPTRRPSRPARSFKIITLAGALEAGTAKRSDEFPVADGRDARGRRARRTPTASPAAARCANSFAHSCNSVFAPLGAELGAEKLVADGGALRLQRGRRRSPAPARSTIPPAGEIGDDLAVGSTAIGQGKVLATAAARWPPSPPRSPRTAGSPQPTLRRGAETTSARGDDAGAVARIVQRSMRAVVRDGHRHRRRDPGRARRRQDRHRGAAVHGQPGPRPGRPGPPHAGRRHDRHRRLVRRLRAGDNPKSRSRAAGRARAPAATPRRRPPSRSCSRRALWRRRRDVATTSRSTARRPRGALAADARQLERAVLVATRAELEEQQRALDRALARRRVRRPGRSRLGARSAGS